MKKLKISPEQEKEFVCLWESLFHADQPIQFSSLRMFNRIVDKLEAISEGDPTVVDEVARALSAKRGQTVVNIWVVNRQLKIDSSVELELEDEDFNFILNRVKAASWSPGVARAVTSLIDMLEAAEKEES